MDGLPMLEWLTERNVLPHDSLLLLVELHLREKSFEKQF